jgi:hAT family C-terminal dimerisation region
LVSTQSSSAYASNNSSVIWAGLNDLLRGKKSSELVKSELDEYLNEPLDDVSLDDEFDILSWWKLKVPRYLVLARLTRDILAVPISIVSSESAFSTSGKTLSPARNSLNDESMEALICA